MRKIMRRVVKWTAVAISLIVVLALGALLVAYWRSDNDCAERAATVPKTPMKAIVYCDYGSPAVLKLEEIEKPVPAEGQVLVKVRAASANPLDYHYMRGTPYLMRMSAGLRKPKVTRLGVDFAGTVEAVGPNVTRFKPGDEVFGTRTGAFGEYVTARERLVVEKPENITFEEAAAIPVAALTALQAVRDKGQIRAGQRILINGASGGVGTFAVQIAKSLGAHVTGVSSTRNVELVRSLGADAVVDYTKQNFTEGGQRYDVIVDMVGNHSLRAVRRVLQPNGRYVMVGGQKGRWVSPMDSVVKIAAYDPFVSQHFSMMLSKLNQEDLATLAGLIREEKIKPVIDRRYSLSEVPEAIRYLETGRARGKVIIDVAQDNPPAR